jgi:hypothetical protein
MFMQTRWIFAALMVAASVATGETNVAISIDGVRDLRIAQLGDAPWDEPDLEGLEIVLRVRGPADTNKYGMVKLTEAIDDLGTNLLQDEDGWRSMNESKFASISENSGLWDGAERDAGVFLLSLHLKNPPRKATKLKRVKGEFQMLVGGEAKEVEIANPAALVDKTIDHPVLSEAGLKLAMGKSNDKAALEMEVKGDDTLIAAMDVISGDGESIKLGSFSSEFLGRKMLGLILSVPPDEKSVLKIRLMVGQERVTMPIELKDIDLP